MYFQYVSIILNPSQEVADEASDPARHDNDEESERVSDKMVQRYEAKQTPGHMWMS